MTGHSVINLTPMGKYQCLKCFREFARSDSLRRHISSGICKGENKDMSDSEESVASSSSEPNDDKKEDIFGKYNEKHLRRSHTDTDDEETDDEEDETPKKKTSKIRPWDKIMNATISRLQDTFNEKVEELFGKESDMDIEDAEVMAYEELKPRYAGEILDVYKNLVGLAAALKKDPMHQKITNTAKRLRDEHDYDADEAMKYAIKKRRFLFEKLLDDYDPPDYTGEDNKEDEVQSSLPFNQSLFRRP